MAPQTVLIISHDLVGPRMAGPGIRCWELARALAGEFHVILAAPGGTPQLDHVFEVISYAHGAPAAWATLEATARTRAGVVVASGYLVHDLPFLRELPVPLVADVYIPMAVESLAWNVCAEPEQRNRAYTYSWEVTRSVAQWADWMICASERQRDFWLGALAAHGRLQPGLYAADLGLRNLVDVVPFGCPERPPQPGPAMKGVWPGIDPTDRVILWGGGVWNWFDPQTLLRAMPAVLARHPEARLVFLGANHPDARNVPEMACARQARALSQELGLEGRAVFWGEWIPYDERGAFLLEADIGVSLHRAGVEPRLAFRTRLLDSIWAGLPMVLTRGDLLADEFERLGLGCVVAPDWEEGVADAINTLLDEPDPRSARREAFDRQRRRYAWQQAAEPLRKFCRAPSADPGRQAAIDMARAGANRREKELSSEIARLQQLVHGYESGRVMRMMAAVRRLLGR